MNKFDFIAFDDNDYVTNNPNVNSGLTKAGLVWAFTAFHSSNWHPLTWLSHMTDCHLFGLNAGWHHLTNLLFHIANALLLFAVLKRMTGTLWRSGFVAAVFAIHPLHVESVAWISERKDVLSTLFWILTMAAYLGYVKRKNLSWYLLTLLVFAFGLLAKPMLVTLPFVLLLLDYWPLGRFEFKGRKFGYLLVEKIPFMVLAAVSCAVTYLAQQKGGATGKTQIMELDVPIANALVSCVRYIGKMFYPNRLAIFYPQLGNNPSAWEVIAAFLILAVLTISFIYVFRRRRYLAVGWLWYLGTLVPVIGIIKVGEQAWADRYSYIPLTGLFIIMAWGVNDILAKWRYKKIALSVLALMVLLPLSIRTHFQLRHWETSETLFEHALDVTENNYLAHMSLAESFRTQGKIDEAIAHTYQAVRIRPDYGLAHHNLGSMLASRGQIDEAVGHFRMAIKARPDYAKAHNNLAQALSMQGKFEQAVKYYREAMRFKPGWAKPMKNLAWLLATHKKSKLYNPKQAIQLAKRACELTNFRDAGILDTLAIAYSAEGRFSQAVAVAENALKLARSAGQKELAEQIQDRLSLYKTGRPYVETQDK